MKQSLWSKGVECGEFCLTLERILDIKSTHAIFREYRSQD